MAKKLLKESTIRRFQKLANVAPINEMYHKRDEDLMEEEDMEMDAGGEEEAPEAEMEGDLELTDEEAQSIIDLGSKLEAAMGGMDDMEMGGEEEAPEMDMEDEEEMGEEELMEALRGISYVPSKGEVINEVAKRVAKRLSEAKKAEKRMNEALGRSKKIINESMDYHDIVLKIERNRRLEKTIMAMQDQSEAIDFIMKKYKCDRDTAQQVLSEIGYYDY